MSNTFSMQRFLRLFIKHTKEHYKTHLMSLGVLTGVLIITLGYLGYIGRGPSDTKEGVFAFLFVLSGCVFTSMIFSDISEKSKALTLLTLPVSSLERFLVGWIYSFTIFPVLFIICFYTVDMAVVSIVNSYAPVYKQQALLDIRPEKSTVYNIFLYSLFLHAATFLGSIFFKKLSFVKTILTVFGFFFVVTLLNQLLIRVLIDPRVSATVPFSTLEIREGIAYHYFEDSSSRLGIVGFMFLAGTLCLWAAAYFRLREKQV